MELNFLLKGIILGFSIAAPVGPIGVLCIHRTLSRGILNGFFSGLGTATADAVYGGIAAFGISMVSAFFLHHQFYFHLFGGIFLLYLGVNTYYSVPALEAAQAEGKGLVGAYTSSFFLTLTNPMTIMSFAAIFAGLGIGNNGGNYGAAGTLVFGVFSGSMFWWVFLSTIVNKLRSRFDVKRLVLVNRISGIVIMGFGIFSVYTV